MTEPPERMWLETKWMVPCDDESPGGMHCDAVTFPCENYTEYQRVHEPQGEPLEPMGASHMHLPTTKEQRQLQGEAAELLERYEHLGQLPFFTEQAEFFGWLEDTVAYLSKAATLEADNAHLREALKNSNEQRDLVVARSKEQRGEIEQLRGEIQFVQASVRSAREERDMYHDALEAELKITDQLRDDIKRLEAMRSDFLKQNDRNRAALEAAERERDEHMAVADQLDGKWRDIERERDEWKARAKRLEETRDADDR